MENQKDQLTAGERLYKSEKFSFRMRIFSMLAVVCIAVDLAKFHILIVLGSVAFVVSLCAGHVITMSYIRMTLSETFDRQLALFEEKRYVIGTYLNQTPNRIFDQEIYDYLISDFIECYNVADAMRARFIALGVSNFKFDMYSGPTTVDTPLRSKCYNGIL